MQRFDVIILGGGLVGLSLAIALGRHGVSSAVIDPADPAGTLAPGFDGRVSAIASASWKLFEAIGVAPHLDGKICPIDRIWVSEGLSGGALDFTPDPDDGSMGYMIPNRDMRIGIEAAARLTSGITRFQPDSAVAVEREEHGVRVRLASGAALSGSLLVGAEGRGSPTRELAGIPVARWSYPHTALVTAIDHEVAHGNTAYEIFYPGGPFALLPMLPGTRSAIVWTVPTGHAPAYMKLPETALLAEAEKRMGSFLGAIKLAAPVQSYPLGYHRAARIVDRRLALVGDAAHGIHPIAGRGSIWVIAMPPRSRKSLSRGCASASSRAMRNCLPATSAGEPWIRSA